MLSLQTTDLEERTTDAQMLRVTKDLQEILRNGANVDRNRKCLDQLASKSELEKIIFSIESIGKFSFWNNIRLEFISI